MTLQGLYAIADTALLEGPRLREFAHDVLAGGATVIQYRDKSQDESKRLRDSIMLRDLCRAKNALFIVNDDIELAKASDADGVHVGRDDATVADARHALGNDCLVGASCYNSAARAAEAAANGADYIALGSFFSSTTKPQAVRANPALIAATRDKTGLPVVAIGGITPHNAALLVNAGADMVAVIRALTHATDARATAAEFCAFFNSARSSTEVIN